MLWFFVGLATSEISDKPFLFVGGKGGVGKSTTAAALATTMSRKKKLLLLSLDPSRPLSKLFDRELSSEPTNIGEPLPNLYVAEALDNQGAIQQELALLVKEYEATNLKDKVSVNPEFIAYVERVLTNIPGLNALFALSRAIDSVEANEFETVVVDTEASGQTLRILDAPAALIDAINKFNKYKGGIAKPIYEILDNKLSAMFLGDIKKGFDTFAGVFKKRLKQYKVRLGMVTKLLSDEHRTRFTMVTTPDVMAVRETQRFLQHLHAANITVGELYVNQVFPITFDQAELDELEKRSDPTEPENLLEKRLFRAAKLMKFRHEIQRRAFDELYAINETQNAHVMAVPFVSSEILGVDKLRKFAGLLKVTPEKVFPVTDPDYFKHLAHDEL